MKVEDILGTIPSVDKRIRTEAILAKLPQWLKDNFEIKSYLGGGGYGIVFEITRKGFDDEGNEIDIASFALKVLDSSYDIFQIGHDTAVGLAQHEIAISKELLQLTSNPNLTNKPQVRYLPIYDIAGGELEYLRQRFGVYEGEDETPNPDLSFVLSEVVKGATYPEDILEKHGIAAFLEVAWKIATDIDFRHQDGINTFNTDIVNGHLVDENGDVYCLDFGAFCSYDQDDREAMVPTSYPDAPMKHNFIPLTAFSLKNNLLITLGRRRQLREVLELHSFISWLFQTLTNIYPLKHRLGMIEATKISIQSNQAKGFTNAQGEFTFFGIGELVDIFESNNIRVDRDGVKLQELHDVLKPIFEGTTYDYSHVKAANIVNLFADVVEEGFNS